LFLFIHYNHPRIPPYHIYIQAGIYGKDPSKDILNIESYRTYQELSDLSLPELFQMKIELNELASLKEMYANGHSI